MTWKLPTPIKPWQLSPTFKKCMFILNMIHKTTLTPIFIKITYNKKVLAGTKKWKKNVKNYDF